MDMKVYVVMVSEGSYDDDYSQSMLKGYLVREDAEARIEIEIEKEWDVFYNSVIGEELEIE